MENTKQKLQIKKITHSNGEVFYFLKSGLYRTVGNKDYKSVKNRYNAIVKFYDKTYIRPITAVEEIIEETLIDTTYPLI